MKKGLLFAFALMYSVVATNVNAGGGGFGGGFVGGMTGSMLGGAISNAASRPADNSGQVGYELGELRAKVDALTKENTKLEGAIKGLEDKIREYEKRFGKI